MSMDVNKLCMGCMRIRETEEQICPHCGYAEGAESVDYGQLQPWTILGGKYLVGKSLGDGGFGITYIGMEIDLEQRVAIKEFYPYGFVTRNSKQSDMVYAVDSASEAFFKEEKTKFIEEGKVLARLDDQSGIVKVKDYLESNGTAYIVMEYLEGENLKSRMESRGGKLPAAEVLKLMQPVIRSMAGIHREGLIHRDISPDNIMITKRGQVKLIDFGAVSSSNTVNAENTILYKPGYSPIEQEVEEGKLGTYSDIYAFCATMYHAITGVLPQDSLLRKAQDTLVPPTDLGAELTPLQEAAIMNGLVLDSEDRIKDAEALYYFLYLYGQDEQTKGEATPQKMQVLVHEKSTAEMVEKLKEKGRMERKKRTIMFGATIAVMVMMLVGSLVTIYQLSRGQQNENMQNTMAQIYDEESGEESEKMGSEETTPQNYLLEKNTLREYAADYLVKINAFRGEHELEDSVVQEHLRDAANELATACAENGLMTAQDPAALCNRLAEETLQKYGCPQAGWMLLYSSCDGSADKVFGQLDKEMFLTTMQNCPNIGVATAQDNNGYIYWIYIAQ